MEKIKKYVSRRSKSNRGVVIEERVEEKENGSSCFVVKTVIRKRKPGKGRFRSGPVTTADGSLSHPVPESVIINGVTIPMFGARPGLQTYSPEQVVAAGGPEAFDRLIGGPEVIKFPQIELTEEEWNQLFKDMEEMK